MSRLTFWLSVVFAVINSIISLAGVAVATLAIFTIIKTKEIQRWNTTFALGSLIAFACIVLFGTGVAGCCLSRNPKLKSLKFYLIWSSCFATLVTIVFSILFFLASIGLGFLKYEKGKDATAVFENSARALSLTNFSIVLCEVLALVVGGLLLMRVKKLTKEELKWQATKLNNENKTIDQSQTQQMPNFTDSEPNNLNDRKLGHEEEVEVVVPPPIKPEPYRSPSDSLRTGSDSPRPIPQEHKISPKPERKPITPISTSSATRITMTPTKPSSKQPSAYSTDSQITLPPKTPPSTASTQSESRSKTGCKPKRTMVKSFLKKIKEKSFSKSRKSESSRTRSSKRRKARKQP